MKLEIKSAKIYKIGPLKSPTEKFTVRDVILDVSRNIEETGDYIEEYIACQAANKNADKVMAFNVGDTVSVIASIGSRSVLLDKKGEEVVYNNVNILNMTLLAAGKEDKKKEEEKKQNEAATEVVDDIPF